MILKIGCKFWIFLLFLILFTSFALLCTSYIFRSDHISKTGSDILNTEGSTNPSAPTLLSDDVQIFDYYDSMYTNYYYRTATTCGSIDYQVCWLQPADNDDDFNLYLYSDSSYSILRATSTRGAGALDWVVFRPGSTQYYYPRGQRYVGAGNAYIEWESGTYTLYIGAPLTASLGVSDYIEIYRVYLEVDINYNFTLDVPNDADYDLYLYQLSYGAATNSSGALRSSTNIGIGLDESISDYRATTFDYYTLLVVRRTGTGSFTLYSYQQNTQPLTDESGYGVTYSSSFRSYYYQTYSAASSSYYHVFWLQPSDIDDDFNLYLYSDNSYSTLLASSTRGAGALEWVVARPSSSQYYYLKGYRYSGTGMSIMEWEVGSYTLTIGNSVSASLSSSECIEVYRVYLSAGTPYAFTLDVPSGADYDLYLYYLSSGATTNSSGALRSSTTIGVDLDETIGEYKPTFTDYYILIVTRRTGTGTSTLYCYSRGVIALSDESAYSESYNLFSLYPYQTSTTASSSYYHAFWLQPADIDDDFNLYLYSDSSYSALCATSKRGAGALDWVVVRPSITQYYYFRGSKDIGIGTATIEWESSSAALTISNPVSASLSSSECIEIYMVYLCNVLRYNFSLNVPDTADYDLYLYYLPSGVSTNISGYISSSNVSGYGFDEAIQNFSPISSDYYSIFVVRRAGSGSFTLFSSSTAIRLADDNSIYNLYNSTDSYYYQTNTTASSSYYHTFWLQPVDIDDDFNLYLYSDISYSVLRASSTSGAGALDWVVVRSSSTQYYYPRVYSYSGIGYGYIEWESSSSTLNIGTPLSASLGASECIEIYMAYLTSGVTYNFTLDVPIGADYDLYLYYLSPGVATNQSGAVRSSTTIGSGFDEIIGDFRATTTDYYIIAVVRQDGNGLFTLYSYSRNTVSLTDESAVYQTYDASFSYYYYKTSSSASSSYYHVFWLQPTEIDDDLNLYLYSDSGYSSLQAASTSSADALDWVLVRPSSSQYYYPKIHRNLGIGSAYIEWEAGSSSLLIGYPTAGILSSSECIEAYRISLSTSNIYNFILDVPETADYDFYLYYLNSGTAINQSGFIKSSTTLGSLDEYLMQYRPQISGDHLVLVVRRSGTGSYTLYCSSNTTYLYDEYAFYDYYNASLSFYYYQTSTTVSTSYYHVMWLQPTEIDDDFNLYLYSDSSYSTLRAASLNGLGRLDWVAFRPSSSQYYYPKAHRYSGIGFMYIEWEISSSTLSIGTPLSSSLSASECIEVYMVYLSAGVTYNFTLDVPSGADYDLYLYYLTSGGATNSSGFLRNSTRIGLGLDETIGDFRAPSSDYYILIVARQTGSGSFTLYSYSRSLIYLTDESAYSESYNSSFSSYYYQTSTTASSSYYHAFWLLPVDIDDDFNLYLYSDSGYSTLRASSTNGAGALDWVMVRPSSTQYYYPLGHRYTGTGNVYIEWEIISTSLSIGTPVSISLNASESIEAYRVQLCNFLRYNFSLSVPDTADYDLYLYYLPLGTATNASGYINSSRIPGNGFDETIQNFSPEFTDYYSIFVVRKGGSGSFTLFSSSTAIRLADDNSIYNLYNSTDSYYYQTNTIASSSYYHTFWLQPVDGDDDFNLYLYSNIPYSILQASSTRSAGALDLVIIRPSSSQYYYPRVSRYSGMGYGYIEWESSSFILSFGTPVTASLNVSECIEVYSVYLAMGVNYNITLDVPDGADYDLYLYYLSSGAATNQSGAIRSSTTIGSGIDEKLGEFQVTTTDYYILAVVRQQGNGSFTLYSYSQSTIFLTDESAAFNSYSASFSYYYYQTGSSASSSYYHVFWLQPTDINNDFNLYLYSNSGYSILQAASTSSIGALDWVIVRPSSSQYYYPKIHRNLGIGSAYIEWDAASSSLSNGYPSSGVLSTSECIETYRISLSTSYTYNFNLDVPDGADFDLYLYYLNSGTALNQSGFVRSSRNLGNFDESILQYRPQISGDHLVLVVRRSGTGTYTFYCSSNTTYLYDEYAFYDYYSSLSSYYYLTNGAPSTSYCHVVWLQPTEVNDDFNLYLYSNSGYSTLRASSTRSAGALDWVVFRPSSAQTYYPKVQRKSGAGYAFIEWEAGSSTLSIGIPLSASLNYSECIESYRVYLSVGTPYNFTLDVPSGADYDLYLYYLSSGNAISWNNYVGSSTNSGSGIDEKIVDYSALYTDYYLILVVRKYGIGTFSLTYVSNTRILLSDDSELGQSYGSSYTDVYYRTSSMASSAYYHVVWLQPYYADDDFDLYLFSDNSYSNFKASSTRGDGCLDWVIFCPSSSQYYYPMVDTKADTGAAYIEWEDGSSTISSGSYVSGSLYYYDCIELYQATLSTSKKYDFSLSVPSGCDFDLYLYFLNSGSAITGSSVYLNASVHSSAGYDESIDDFQPPKSGNYAIIVVWKSGSGSYFLYLNSGNAPTDPLNHVITTLLIFVIIGIIGVSAVAIYKYKEIWASPPTSSQSAPSTPAMRSERSNKPKAYKQPEPSEPHYPQISKQKVRPFDYYCLYCGKLVRAGRKCQNCD